MGNNILEGSNQAMSSNIARMSYLTSIPNEETEFWRVGGADTIKGGCITYRIENAAGPPVKIDLYQLYNR